MTDHIAEQIGMKFKAATVPQPPTELVWPISTISTALAVRNGSESSRCRLLLCTFVTHLRGCTWQPIFRVFEVLKAVIYEQHKTQSIKRKHRGGNLPCLSGDGTEGLLALVEVLWPLHALY
jgi:hypothetical protein